MKIVINKRMSRALLVLVLIAGMTFLIIGCSTLQSQSDPVGDEGGALDEIDLSGEDGDGSGSEGGDSGDGDAPIDNPGDVNSAAIACPSELTDFTLFVSHTWDFSPNRDLEKMRVNGQTNPSSPCPFSVAGSTVIMEQCRVPITNSGFIQSDDGSCDISSSGTALISIDDASCDGGVITMTFEESIDPDSGSGAMNCPNTSQPYIPIFPFSRTTRSFHIMVGGTDAIESVDPDLSGQFKYNKTWSVYSSALISPPLPE